MRVSGRQTCTVNNLLLHLQGLAASLLTHDSPAIKLGDPAGRARLSTLGCAMLATVLRLPKVRRQDRLHCATF